MKRPWFGQLVALLAVSASFSVAALGGNAAERLAFQRDGQRLTVHCDDVPAQEVLDLLEGEGLATLSGPAGVADRRVTIHEDGASLETVMRHLLRQAGVTNHAVRYDGKTGLATFVVLSEEAPKDRPGKRPSLATAAADQPAKSPQAEPTPMPQRRPRPPRAEPEKGFGALLGN